MIRRTRPTAAALARRYIVAITTPDGGYDYRAVPTLDEASTIGRYFANLNAASKVVVTDTIIGMRIHTYC